jgi:hypothetical protein
MWKWLSELQGAQTGFIGSLTGSALGIVALVIGALINFWLNRKRDAHLLTEDADAVAAALYGEIHLDSVELAHSQPGR